MSEVITLYSFADFDRSGKVRWTARELGYEIEERQVEFRRHLEAEYRSINPYGQIPAARLDGEWWCESTAICLMLAERHPESGLLPTETDRRERFWQDACAATQSLEWPVVNYYLAQVGIVDKAWASLVEDALRRRLPVLAAKAPTEGFWLGEFSLADVFVAYVLRIGVSAGLLEAHGVLGAYLQRLRARPAAIQARFFDSPGGG